MTRQASPTPTNFLQETQRSPYQVSSTFHRFHIFVLTRSAIFCFLIPTSSGNHRCFVSVFAAHWLPRLSDLCLCGWLFLFFSQKQQDSSTSVAIGGYRGYRTQSYSSFLRVSQNTAVDASPPARNSASQMNFAFLHDGFNFLLCPPPTSPSSFLSFLFLLLYSPFFFF